MVPAMDTEGKDELGPHAFAATMRATDVVDSASQITRLFVKVQAVFGGGLFLVSLVSFYSWLLLSEKLGGLVTFFALISLFPVGFILSRVLYRRLLQFRRDDEQRVATAQAIASRDPLTGLLNRRRFYERLEGEIESARRVRGCLSLLVLDMDGLKQINDEHGHAAGDAALQRLAQVLNSSIRPNDNVCRLGGDEFAVILPGADHGMATMVAARIHQGLREGPLGLSARTAVVLRASTGSATFPGSGDDAEALVNWADANLYANKLPGKSAGGSESLRDRQKVVTPVVAALSATMHIRDKGLHHHSRRAAEIAVAIAQSMGLGEEAVWSLQQGALLHDVGKIGLADSILKKTSSLSAAESKAMRRHPELGYRVVRGVAALDDVAEIVYAHHERYDGTGYPRGLVGEEIPIGARIFAVADAHDAMTYGRPYRAPLSQEDALGEIALQAGRQFDPRVVAAFIQMVRDDNDGDAALDDHRVEPATITPFLPTIHMNASA